MNETNISLWEKVGNGCLQKANELLKSENIPTAGTVEMIYRLVSTAIAIDILNLQWASRSQSGEQVY